MAFRSSKSEATTMSLAQHLGELRMRLIRSILAVALGAAAILAFYDPVLRFLTTMDADDDLDERRLCDYYCRTNYVRNNQRKFY